MEPEAEEDNNETFTAENSILHRKPVKVFGHTLSDAQQMWLGFIVPASISTIIFIVNFSLDVAVAYQLFRDAHPFLAGATIALIYAPSFVCLVLTFTRTPHLDNTCDSITWILIQLLQCLLFPVGIIYRFATRLFWSIVALTEEDPIREKALCIAAASHQAEFFFFVDSFLNAAPQALLQAYILLSPDIPTANETAWTQAVSIVASVITLSKTAALYQRFESQRVVGRTVPWEFQTKEAHANALVNFSKVDPSVLMGLEKFDEGKSKKATDVSFVITSPSEEQHQTEEEQSKESVTTTQIPNAPNIHKEGQEQEQELGPTPLTIQLSSHPTSCDQEISESTEEKMMNTEEQGTQNNREQPNEMDVLLPDKERNSSPENTAAQSSSHYLEPLVIQAPSLEDRCFWPRINTPPSSPTADPHMRPRLSINTIKATKRPSFHSQIALPVRKPRKVGLHEDEPLGIFTAFNAWSMYLLGRVLVIASFTHFYLWPSLGLILGHYAIMVAYLSFCTCPNFWAPLLGLIFILCPLEVKVHYRYPRIFLLLFFVLTLLEDLSTVVLWYCGAEWESSWYDFAFFFIVGCHGMAALNVSLYLFFFKPQTKYIEQSSRPPMEQLPLE